MCLEISEFTDFVEQEGYEGLFLRSEGECVTDG
jgi:hypothetical protein